MVSVAVMQHIIKKMSNHIFFAEKNQDKSIDQEKLGDGLARIPVMSLTGHY
jgi:hypothetical protein